MRIVLDTNVLVAGLLSSAGPPGVIVEALLAGALDVAFDARIRAEYDDVLRRREFQFPEDRIGAVLAVIDRFGLQASGVHPWPHPLPDPADEPFIAVAAATASELVTGNLRHFPARCRGGVIVRTPREFIDAWRRSADLRT
jgi:predicted nucleic acid-binding protein